MVAAQKFTNGSGRSVVVGLPESALATAAVERLHRRGWQVYRAATCEELRELACRHMPDAVVLPADGPDESGWLACAKLTRGQPRLRVIVVGERSGFALRFAYFVGAAAVVAPTASAAELVARVEGAVPLTV
jgi:DNA-binding response OmpR family regulator